MKTDSIFRIILVRKLLVMEYNKHTLNFKKKLNTCLSFRKSINFLLLYNFYDSIIKVLHKYYR